jgi:hypothetical protein
MKKITLKTTVFLFVILIATACVVNRGASANAPGQIKKETGAKSAKEYAPGQQKKKP